MQRVSWSSVCSGSSGDWLVGDGSAVSRSQAAGGQAVCSVTVAAGVEVTELTPGNATDCGAAHVTAPV